MLSLIDIEGFLNNIYFSKGKIFDREYLSLWAKEIMQLNVDVETLNKAQNEIVREDVPLVMNKILDIIKANRKALPVKKSKYCPYCEGRGSIIAIKFDVNGKLIGTNYILNCSCGNKYMIGVVQIQENPKNHHKTIVKDGYFLAFSDVVDMYDYIEKVYKNKDYDLEYRVID